MDKRIISVLETAGGCGRGHGCGGGRGRRHGDGSGGRRCDGWGGGPGVEIDVDAGNDDFLLKGNGEGTIDGVERKV
jgi:hypothetical protein